MITKSLLTTAFLAVGCASCSMFSNSPPPAPPPPYASRHAAPEQPLAMSQDTTSAVQDKLRALGYYKGGKVDGVYGHDTERALRVFQEKNGLLVTGQIDGPTLQALKLTPKDNGDTPVDADKGDVAR